MKIKYILTIMIMLLAITQSKATNYTWVGSTSTAWNVSSNWNPASVPDSVDNVTISSGTYNLVLDQNRKVTNLTLSNKTIDLNGFSLTVYGVATMTSGTVTNGDFVGRGSLAAFNGTLMDCPVDADCGYIRLSGSTFNEVADFTDQGLATGLGAGGCTFNDDVTITHNGTLTYFTLGYTTGDTFNANVEFVNNSNREINVASSGTTIFNGNVVLNSTSTGGISFAGGAGSSTLASGKTISIGGSGFTADYLTLKNFTQTGSTAQTLTLTSTAVVNMISCTFNGNLTVSSPGFLLKNSTFNGTSSFTRTGSSGNHQSDGGNTFNGSSVTVDNSGSSGRIRWATTTPDVYNGNATFNSSGGWDVQIAYSGDNLFSGDITIISNKVVFNTASGKVTFTGGNSQTLNGSYNFPFKKLAINKSANHVTANTTLSVDDTLFFVFGNLITTSSYLLTMKAGSVASGASNSSFVSGPVKKTGNTAFQFPVGKGNYFRSVEITAPSNVTDAFTAEFIDSVQTNGSNKDTTLVSINPCDYWTLSRTTGSSNIKVTLNWNSNSCNISYPANVRVASWNGTKWVDLGNDNYSGNLSGGFVKAYNTSSTYSAFLLANISTPYTGAPNLTSASDFAILSDRVILSDSITYAKGKAGSAGDIENVISSDSLLTFSVGSFNTAIQSLDSAILYCNGLTYTPTSNLLDGQTFNQGVYTINSDVTIDSIINLNGDSTSIFIFNINGSFHVDSSANIKLNGVYPQNIYWNINKEVSCKSYSSLPGIILASKKISIHNFHHSLLSLMSRDSILLYSNGDETTPSIFSSVNNISNAILGGTLCTFPTDPCNMVLNSNFDLNDQIPLFVNELTHACPWTTPFPPGGWVGTPDYFNVNCPNTPAVGIPLNVFGHQSDNTGPNSAYAGLFTQKIGVADQREYIQQPIQATLQANKIYYSEMFVSLADLCSLSCDAIGMYFTDNPVSQVGYSLINVSPQVQSPILTQINDKTNWVRVSGCHPAVGNESYVVIGNFRTDAQTQTAPAPANTSPASGAPLNSIYYFIDDVSTVPFEVNAGADATVDCDATVQLGLSTCINDLNTGQFTYNWIQLSGPLTPSLSDPTIFNPTVTFSNNTGSNIVQVYQVTVTSPDGCTATDLISITVESCGTEACDEGMTYCFENYIVSGTEDWNTITNPACSGNIVTIENELRIPAGTELIIDGIEVHFGPTGKIIVERGTIGGTSGGVLQVLNKATLTAITDVCMWQGIQVWGYKNFPFAQSAQGRVWLDRSEISYAHCGVYFGRRDNYLSQNIGGFTGGFAEEIDSCLFKDNYVGVCFPLGYPSTLGTPLNIHDCKFLCEAPMRDPYYVGARSKYFIDINRRLAVNNYDPNTFTHFIKKNVFINTPPNVTNSTTAIRCNSSIAIPFLNNDFFDVDRGIFFLSSNGNGLKNVVAEGNYFRRCNIGIYNLSNKSNTIHNSVMEEGSSGFLGISVGILNENSVGSIIQGNRIDDFFGGIIVTRSGHIVSLPLKIWENSIDNCNFSLLSGGNNFYSLWQCNDLSNYNAGNAWTLYDVLPAGNNFFAKIQEHGLCSNYPSSNKFNIITPSPPILDIENQTSSSIDFIYNVSTSASTNNIPDPVNGPVIVNSCGMPVDESTYCSGLTSPFRFAAEILVERDTTRDTTKLNYLNAEIYGYYIQINEIDSAIAFIDTMQNSEIDEMLIDLYFIKENTDSVFAILNRLPNGNEVEYDYKRYMNILYELMVDSLTLHEMDSAQLNTIAEIALGESEVGYYCKGIINEIYSKPIDYTCEVVNACGSPRFANEVSISKINSYITNYPNPCSISTTFFLPKDIASPEGLKLQIYNQMGQIIVKLPINQLSDFEFYCDNLENGLYLYHFIAPNYKSPTGKMIVIRN